MSSWDETFPRRRLALATTDRRGGKSVFILRGRFGEALRIEDRELIHCCLPVVCRSAPIGRDVAQRQPDQFGGRVVAGKVPASLDDLAQPRVDALDGIRRIHHLALQDRLADAAYFLFAWGQPLPGGSMKRANKCMVATNLRSGIAHDHHVRVYPLKRGAIDGRRPLHAPRNDVRRCAKLCQKHQAIPGPTLNHRGCRDFRREDHAAD